MARRPVCFLSALSLFFFVIATAYSLGADGADAVESKSERSSLNSEGLPVDSSAAPHGSAHPLVKGAGQELRRLAGRAGRARTRSKASQGVSWGHLLLALGSIISGFALWRKTSELHHSPRQALRKVVMHLKGQVPSSWEAYVESLPVLDPDEFPDLRPVAGHLQKKPIVVMFLEKPSTKLAEFLKLSSAQRREGIVVKAKSTAQRTAKEVGFEMFAHQELADGLPFALPSLGAYRDVDTETVYLITPRARADVGEYTRAMPDKVNLKLAWAEMIWSLWAMHKRGWVHRDIKSFNYFVSQDGHALLADFEGYWRDGMYAIIYGEESEIIFTDRYVAPEMTFDEEYQLYDAKGDVFALGVTFKEMMRWMSGVGIPDANLARDLVSHMIEANPGKRYSLKECSEHPFFDGIDFGKLETRRYGKAFEGNFFSSYKFI